MALPQEVRYTYADVLSWDDDVRYELYDGRPVALASPAPDHQRIFRGLFLQIGNYLNGKKCEVLSAPLDVRLFERDGDRPEDVRTVVQPDIMIVCDKNKIDSHGVHGAPDLVIEILSESNRRNDRLVKFRLYQKAGVREYWIVDPDARVVLVHLLDEGQYGSPEVYPVGTRVPVSIAEDLAIDLTQVFPEE